MTLSRLERITIVFTLTVIAFLSGWFLSRQHQAALTFVPAPSPSVGAEEAPAPSASTAPSPSAPALVNINTADAEQLRTLPGIGAKRAADIIAYREAHGPFAIPEAISDVPGIGTALLEGIIDRITVEEES